MGSLRFAKPATPTANWTLQTGEYGPSCSGGDIGRTGTEGLSGVSSVDEDCLFLDVYVPRKAFTVKKKLPVIIWFYGGGYVMGSKDLYNGASLIKQSQGNAIFVASNYRLGSFGFLAGTTVENAGVANAGFYDQRAALQWIQYYIHLLNGDRNNVSAWGESAGAGSIMHHLTAFGGSQDPLFRRALIQSAGFEPKPDRKGALEAQFKVFEEGAGCKDQGLPCLRNATLEAINNGQRAVIAAGFGIGPAVDGSWVRRLPQLELENGNYWKDMDSVIVSHVADEAELFTPLAVDTEEKWKSFVASFYRNQTALTESVLNEYSDVDNLRQRVKTFIGDSTFYCNTRSLLDAFSKRSYALRYSRRTGIHGADVLADFYDPNSTMSPIIEVMDPGFGRFATTFQSALLSHARTGDPNALSTKNNTLAVHWPLARPQGNGYSDVLNAGENGFTLVDNDQVPQDRCRFWSRIFAKTGGDDFFN